jgi:deoxycytidylate deaminase
LKVFDKVREISFALLNEHPTNHRCRHFSFIVEGSRILKIGFNRDKTHPKNLLYDYRNRSGELMSNQIGIHSEMDAVIKFGETDCSGLMMINTRINRNNVLDLSKPCRGCIDMVKRLNFKQVYYNDTCGAFKQLY